MPMITEPSARLLIVEDDADLAELLALDFAQQGYAVERAGWGGEALALAQAQDFDLVLLDICLPDQSGHEVFRQLRGNRRSAVTPVLFLTERRAREDRVQGLELGVVDYITKPFDLHELRLRVRNAIRNAAVHTQLHPVTRLPDVALTGAALDGLLASGRPWAVLRLSLSGLDALREAQGFLAADDMLRALALLVENTVRELGTADDLVGHDSPQSLLVLTSAGALAAIRERIAGRVRASIRQFSAPILDKPPLDLHLTALDHTSGCASAQALQAALLNFSDPLEHRYD